MEGSGGNAADAVKRYFAGLEQGNWAAGAEVASPDVICSWEEPAQPPRPSFIVDLVTQEEPEGLSG